MTACSGIGAPEVAAPWIDWRYQSEIDPFPRAVLAHRFPDAIQLGDMTKFQEWPDADLDVLCGGTPCQSFSVAGLRAGLADPRGNLMLTYLAIAARYRPRWLVWENVPGVLSADSHEAPDPRPPEVDLDSDDGPEDGAEVVVEDEYDSEEDHAFACFLAGLQELGYGFAYRTLDAEYVRTCGFPWAIPQRRRRVFVVGYLGDWRRAAAVLFDGESLRGNPPPRREAGKGLAGTSGAGPDGSRIAPVCCTIPARTKAGGGLGTDFDCDGELITSVANPLTARMGKGINTTADEGQTPIPVVANALRGEGHDASEDGTGRQTLVPTAQGVALRGRDGGGTAELTGPVSPALRASQGGGDKPHVMAIQERAVSENANSGPDGSGVRNDGAAYTIEARTVSQAVAFDTTQVTSPHNYSAPKLGDPCHPLAAGAHPPAVAIHGTQDQDISEGVAHPLGRNHGQENAVAFAQNQRGELRESDVSLQLTTGGGKPGEGYPAVRQGWAVRRLTPLECERLMGFPDGWTDVPYRGKPHAADGPRYKALGNSWATNCGEWIFDRIKMLEGMA